MVDCHVQNSGSAIPNRRSQTGCIWSYNQSCHQSWRSTIGRGQTGRTIVGDQSCDRSGHDQSNNRTLRCDWGFSTEGTVSECNRLVTLSGELHLGPLLCQPSRGGDASGAYDLGGMLGS